MGFRAPSDDPSEPRPQGVVPDVAGDPSHFCSFRPLLFMLQEGLLMRIAYDGTTLKPGQTGVGLYTEHLLRHLVQRLPKDELFVISNDAVTTSEPLPARARIREDFRFPNRSIWMQLLAPLALNRIQARVAHFTNSLVPLLSPVPMIVTLHDMSLNLFPRYHPWKRQLMRPLIHLSARKAAAIITVSENSRRDIIRLMGIPAEKVHRIPEAPAPCFRPGFEPERLLDVRRRYRLERPLALFVGTLEPRKNLPRLIQGFKRLRESGLGEYQLVCAGAFGWGYREVRRAIEDLDLQDSVRLLGYVPHRDLPVLYNLATLFVFPSLYEGFGLPVMEAMACGVPVVTSRNSSLSEISQGCAQLVDPRQPDAIAEAMIRLLRDSELRQELRARGLRVAQQYSWDQAADATLDLYRSVGRSV